MAACTLGGILTAMGLLLIVAAALAGGLLGGPWQRAAIVARTAAAGDARAACPACGRGLLRARFGWPETGLAGRCRSCHASLGPPALAVELCTAALIGMLAVRVHPVLVLAAACWLAFCAVPLGWIDAAVQRLPDALTIPAAAGTMLLLTLAAAAGGDWPSLLRAAAGGAGLAGCYLAANMLGPAAVGRGDAKLSVSLGALLGWAGWDVLAGGVAVGFVLAAAYGAALLALRRATLRQRIPFGPFMMAGAFLAVLAAGTGSR